MAVRARIADGAERDEQYPRFVALVPGYADYEGATTRTIPVVFLDPVGARIQRRADESSTGCD